MTRSIAIIGGGIVGSTAAYYLSRAKQAVTLFDDGTGQASKAAAGIICPWFSLRRNKPWYFLVSQGAEFYPQMMAQLAAEGIPTKPIYRQNGAIILRRHAQRITDDLEQAQRKRSLSPTMGQVWRMTGHEIQDRLPLLKPQAQALFVEGGGQVDGRELLRGLEIAATLHGCYRIPERAEIYPLTDGKIRVQTPHYEGVFDTVLLSAGAWLPEILAPLGYQVAIQAQKGQLFTLNNPVWTSENWPVVMPYGEIDVIPAFQGGLTIGATHENEKAYHLEPDISLLNQLKIQAQMWVQDIESLPIEDVRVGTRAHTPDYGVLVGRVPGLENVWAISGLGSSGLTSGPYLAYQWSRLILEGSWAISQADFPIKNYIPTEI